MWAVSGILRTLGRVFAGFILACIAAGLVQVLFVDTPRQLASLPASDLAGHAGTTLELTLLTATHFAIFSSAFALIAAGIAEWLGLRSPAYWLAAGTGIALLGFTAQYASEVAGQPSIFNNYALQAYLTAGFFGGLVYWLIAGVHSGERHLEPQLVSAPQAPRPRVIVEKAQRGGGLRMGSLAEKLALRRKSKDTAAAAGEALPADVVISQPARPSKPAAQQDGSPASASGAKPTAVPVTKSGTPHTRPAPEKPQPPPAPTGRPSETG